MQADIHIGEVENRFMVTPLTDDGREWLKDHIGNDIMLWCNAVPVEARYIQELSVAILDDGLSITKDGREMVVGQDGDLYLR